MSRIGSRLTKLERVAADRPDPSAGWVTTLVCHPVETDPDGRGPGFYPADDPRSTAADLVFAGDRPVIPEHVLAPHGLVVTSDTRPVSRGGLHPSPAPG